MRLYTAAQMRAADAGAAAAGVPTAQLMDAAGKGVAEAVRRWYPSAEQVVVLCGSGNNGGDGYVAATTLAGEGVLVSVFELAGAAAASGGQTEHGSAPELPDAVAARLRHVAAGHSPALLTEHTAEALLKQVSSAPSTVVIDALFGSGLNRPLEGWLARFVLGLNQTGAQVVAVDVPSGLSADVATPIGPHVQAQLTVELAGHKPASLFYPARRAYGRRLLIDLGIPERVLREASQVEVLSAPALTPHLPARDPAGHKYDAGTVCVVAGSEAYLGAAELACRGAWRGGAGLVTLVASQRLASAWPETIFEQHAWLAVNEGASAEPRSGHALGSVNPRPAPWPPENLTPRRAAALVIGPGLDEAALQYLAQMIEWAPGPVVLDAAALAPTSISAVAEQLARTPVVITPHAGEAERLLRHLPGSGGVCAQPGLVASDPLGAAARLAEATNAITVLKGPTTVICAPGGRTAVSVRGTPALATGGTGDVLAGLLGALLAKPGGSQSLFERACLAVWLHGVAGELAAAELGHSLVATDVAERLPRAIRQLTRPNP